VLVLYCRAVTDFVERPLVSTAWLADHLADPNLRIVDARWRGEAKDAPGTALSRALFQATHIPGAVPFHWHYDLSHTVDGVRDMLLPPERFAEVMAAAGIGDDTTVVAYAETDYSGAARLWWALRYYGHEQVAILDGGLDKWQAEGRAIATRTVKSIVALVRFTARPQPKWLATGDEIQRALHAARGELAQVDTRPLEQYMGQAVWTPHGSRYSTTGAPNIDIGARGPMRSGHIATAVHLHASANLDPTTWTYLPPEVLRARVEAAGVRPAQHFITYCGVGISASLGLFSLYLAGYRNLALYDGSWEEWGTDPSRPIETGPDQNHEELK
jgi:thiosulfate/3-mercaptopyruvate sulfurtransferase